MRRIKQHESCAGILSMLLRFAVFLNFKQHKQYKRHQTEHGAQGVGFGQKILSLLVRKRTDFMSKFIDTYCTSNSTVPDVFQCDCI